MSSKKIQDNLKTVRTLLNEIDVINNASNTLQDFDFTDDGEFLNRLNIAIKNKQVDLVRLHNFVSFLVKERNLI